MRDREQALARFVVAAESFTQSALFDMYELEKFKLPGIPVCAAKISPTDCDPSFSVVMEVLDLLYELELDGSIVRGWK